MVQRPVWKYGRSPMPRKGAAYPADLSDPETEVRGALGGGDRHAEAARSGMLYVISAKDTKPHLIPIYIYG